MRFKTETGGSPLNFPFFFPKQKLPRRPLTPLLCTAMAPFLINDGNVPFLDPFSSSASFPRHGQAPFLDQAWF